MTYIIYRASDLSKHAGMVTFDNNHMVGVSHLSTQTTLLTILLACSLPYSIDDPDSFNKIDNLYCLTVPLKDFFSAW